MGKRARQTHGRDDRCGPSIPDDWELLDSGGPGPFVTWATDQLPDGSRYSWHARYYRKGSGPCRLAADRVGLRTARSRDDIATVNP